MGLVISVQLMKFRLSDLSSVATEGSCPRTQGAQEQHAHRTERTRVCVVGRTSVTTEVGNKEERHVWDKTDVAQLQLRTSATREHQESHIERGTRWTQ